MPPRLTPRKFFLTFLVIIGVTLLVGSKYHFSYFSNRSRSHGLDGGDNNGLEEHTEGLELEKEEVINELELFKYIS